MKLIKMYTILEKDQRVENIPQTAVNFDGVKTVDGEI